MKNLNRHIQKISAFLISVGLWFYVLNTEVETDSKNFFLEFVTPPGFNFSSPPPEKFGKQTKISGRFIGWIASTATRQYFNSKNQICETQ